MTAPPDFADFCMAEHSRLVGALSLYCGDRDIAEDLAQEALVRACQRWSQVRQMPAPGAWVYRVALNLAHSHFRRARTLRRLLERRTPAQPEPLPQVEQVAMRMLVAGLPRRQREALVARFYLDLSVAETAQALGTSESSVRSLTHRAIQALREQVGVAHGPVSVKEHNSGA